MKIYVLVWNIRESCSAALKRRWHILRPKRALNVSKDSCKPPAFILYSSWVVAWTSSNVSNSKLKLHLLQQFLLSILLGTMHGFKLTSSSIIDWESLDEERCSRFRELRMRLLISHNFSMVSLRSTKFVAESWRHKFNECAKLCTGIAAGGSLLNRVATPVRLHMAVPCTRLHDRLHLIKICLIISNSGCQHVSTPPLSLTGTCALIE